jgi:hypothetical protein
MSKRTVNDPSQHGWIDDNGKWVWEGGPGAGMVISSVEPSNPQEGQLWFNTNAGLMLAWDGTYWFEPARVGGADLDNVVTSVDGHIGDVDLSAVYAPYDVYVKQEVDPTVPLHVKSITHEEIDQWNNNSGGSPTWEYAEGGSRTEANGYAIHRFTSSGTFRIPSGSYPRECQVLIVGGGGSTQRSMSDPSGNKGLTGGGGSGAVIMSTVDFNPQQDYVVTVGKGGIYSTESIAPTDSEASSISLAGVLDLTAEGGGKGGRSLTGDSANARGEAGGSGGGGARLYGDSNFATNSGGSAVNPQADKYGHDGAAGAKESGVLGEVYSGQGGGAGAPGNLSGENHETAITVDMGDGDMLYARGGSGVRGHTPHYAPDQGIPGSGGSGYYSQFSQANQSGVDGIVIIRYLIPNQRREALRNEQ